MICLKIIHVGADSGDPAGMPRLLCSVPLLMLSPLLYLPSLSVNGGDPVFSAERQTVKVKG